MNTRPIVIAMLAAAVAAQSRASGQASTGSLQGTVVSGTVGAPVGDAHVVVRSDALQGQRETVTDEQGRFRFLALPPGRYTIDLRRIGHRTVRITDVAVTVGTAISVGVVQMSDQAARLSEIVISGARPTIDPVTAALENTLDSTFFRSLPTDRDYRSVFALVPHALPSPYGDGVNVGGSTGFENAYFVDGLHATNPLQGNGGLLVPFNFVRDVEVITGGYEAEYGRSQGAVVNVVTNSGGNEFRTEAVSFFTNQSLRATPRAGLASGSVDDFAQYDVGLSFGGPVRRDRLWFYAAYNPSFETRDVAFGGIGTNHDVRIRHLFAGKLTWAPSSRTDVVVSILGDPSQRKSIEGAEVWPAPLATVTSPSVVKGMFRDGGSAATLNIQRRIGGRMLFSGLLSRMGRIEQRRPRGGADDAVSLARFDDQIAETTSGSYGRSYRVNVARTGAEASLTLPTGDHTAKIGLGFERNLIDLPFFYESFAGRRYLTGDDAYTWLRTFWHSNAHTSVPAAYVQDSWEITNRLRLNAGVRWEGQFIAGDRASVLDITDEWSPRIGIVFMPRPMGDQKLSASFGRFYEQVPLWAVALWANPWKVLDASYPRNPLIDSAGGSVFVVPARHVMDSDIRGQHFDEVTAGYERRLGSNFHVSVRGIHREMRWIVEDVFAELGDSLFFIVGNPGRSELSVAPKAKRRYTAAEFTVDRMRGARTSFIASYVISRTIGNYSGLFDTDTRQPLPNSNGNFDFPSQWTYANGSLPNDRRHLAKFTGSYKLSDALTVGGTSYLASGAPLSEFAWDPIAGWYSNVRPRGSNGRTPLVWNADLRFSYEIPARTRTVQARLLLDVFNVGNQRRAVDIEQLHYYDAEHTSENPNYLKVNQYQQPLSVRLGMIVGF